MKRFFTAGARRREVFLWAMVCALSTAGAQVLAQADSSEAARAALAAGNWQEAADLGEATGTAAGWAVAVDALSIQAYYVAPEEERGICLAGRSQLNRKTRFSVSFTIRLRANWRSWKATEQRTPGRRSA